MASSKAKTQGKPSEGGRATRQKQRSEGSREKARAAGGGLRNTPAEDPPGRSASTGGRATKSSVRDHANSRSSNAGRQRSQNVSRQP